MPGGAPRPERRRPARHRHGADRASIADAYRRFILPTHAAGSVLLCGGGARNPTLRRMLAAELAPIRSVRSGAPGIPIDAKEAWPSPSSPTRPLHGRPRQPSAATTGTSAPAVLGRSRRAKISLVVNVRLREAGGKVKMANEEPGA